MFVSLIASFVYNHIEVIYLVCDGIRQGPEPGIGTGGYELGTGAVE